MKDELNQIYDEMTKLLLTPIVFYIPSRVWNQLGKEKWEDKMYDNIFDNVILIKPDGSDTLLNNEPSIHHLIIKKQRLDKNTFKLLVIQKDLNEKQFKFLLNKYCVQLDFCRRVAVWMVENIYEDIKNISEETFLSFELQQTSIKEHWHHVQENFLDASKTNKIGNDGVLSEKDLKSFQDLMNPTGILSNAIRENSLLEKTSSSPKKPKKEKKILVTEEEATSFLLRTVFNMK